MSDLINSFSFSATVLSAPEEGNLSDTLNAGLAHCTAPFVARIDQDDIAEPSRLARQCAELNRDSNCVVLGSNATLIDESGQVIGERLLPESADDVLRMMRWKAAVMHPTVTFRTESIRAAGGYSPVAANVEDYDLWLRALRHGTIRSLPDKLLRYRLHGNQMTQTKKISKASARVVRDSRLALARARGESVLAARFRQGVWAAKQTGRRWTR